MDDFIITKLKRRAKRVYESYDEPFYTHLKNFYQYLNNTEILRAVVAELLESEKNAKEKFRLFSQEVESISFDSEKEHMATSYFIIESLVDNALPIEKRDSQFPLYLEKYTDPNKMKTYGELVRIFCETFLLPLTDYIEEQIDESRLIIAIAARFKKKVELFNKEAYFAMFEQDKRKGEDNLALKFYEYLLDNRVELFVEPRTSNGKIDMVILESPNRTVIADAKIFDNDGRNKKYIIDKGVGQVLTHIKEANQSTGFLLIYEVCVDNLFFNLRYSMLGIPYTIIENKTIFFITIDIARYGKTSSKRGRNPVIEITEKDFNI